MNKIDRMILAFLDTVAMLYLFGSMVGYWWLQLAFGKTGLGLDIMLRAGFAIMALMCIAIAGVIASVLWIAVRIMTL